MTIDTPIYHPGRIMQLCLADRPLTDAERRELAEAEEADLDMEEL